MTQMPPFNDPALEDETDPLALDNDPTALAAYQDTLTLLRLRAAAKAARGEGKLSQTSVAKEMGTTQSAISDLESGRVDAQISTWQRYARALGRRFSFSLERLHSPARIPVATLALSPVLRELSRAATARTVESIALETRIPALFVTSILTELEQKGWALSSRKGGADNYILDDGVANLIGLSIHGDRIVGTLVDMKGRPQTTSLTVPLLSSTPESVVDQATDLTRDLFHISHRMGKPVLGVGACLAGIVGAQNGRVTYAPDLQGKDDGWADVDLEVMLQHRIQQQVHKKLRAVVLNDANALALSHYRGRGFAPRSAADVADYDAASAALILITGAGIGSGIIANGKLLQGSNSRAGEIGHLIVERGEHARPCRMRMNHSGCLETVASPQGILRSLGLPSATSVERSEGMEKANAEIEAGNEQYHREFLTAGMRFGAALPSIGLLDAQEVAIYCAPALHMARYATARVFRAGVEESLDRAHESDLMPPDYHPELRWLSLEEDTLARAAGVAMLVSEFLQKADEWYPGLGENDRSTDLVVLDETTQQLHLEVVESADVAVML